MTAVSNRPESFPLSLSHSSAVSFNLDKNKKHQPSTQPCPEVPPMSPPRATGLSSWLASAEKGVILTLSPMHRSSECVAPSQEKVCDVFQGFLFTLHSISWRQKRLDSLFVALALAHLGRSPCLWRGAKLQRTRRAYLNAHITSSMVLKTDSFGNL